VRLVIEALVHYAVAHGLEDVDASRGPSPRSGRVIHMAPWGVAGPLTRSGTLISARYGNRSSMRSPRIRARLRRTGRSSSGAITRSTAPGVTGSMLRAFAACPWPL
jgi:hypothetical protein